MKKNKSPFYNIQTGKVSGYNDIGQVMFKTLLENHNDIETRFKKNILKNFGPGSAYWKNLKLRNKYKKVKDWRSLIKGPWIHQNVIETIKNIKSKKRLTLALKGSKDPIDEFIKKFEKNSYFRPVIKNLKMVIKLKKYSSLYCS